jgi:hypothetical protein
MSTGSGDRLARGAVKASWGPIEVSKEKWASIWEGEEVPPITEEPKTEVSEPVHVRTGIK